MKTSNTIFSLALAVGLIPSLLACGNTNSRNTEQTPPDDGMTAHFKNYPAFENTGPTRHNGTTIAVLINQYMSIKNALVQDRSKVAAEAGQKLATAADAFDISTLEEAQQAKGQGLLKGIKEQAEHIANQDISSQRMHFEAMSKNVLDLIALTGTDRTLYQQYCPMYNKGKGGTWLSESKEIKNPLFGIQMLTCGHVKKTIAVK